MTMKPSTPPYHGGLRQHRNCLFQKTSLALCLALAFGAAQSAQAAGPATVAVQRAAPYWQDLRPDVSQTAATSSGKLAASATSATSAARTPALRLKRLRMATLDAAGMQSLTAGAPHERTTSALASSQIVSLPHPDGGYQRFTLVESPIMEAGLAAKHPEIKTYRGRGIDDPAATLRMDITPLGLHASVRSANGGWYVDPYYHLDTSVYASYSRSDLLNQHGPLVEGALDEAQLSLSHSFYKEGEPLEVRGSGFVPGATVSLTVRGEGDAAALQTAMATADAKGNITVALAGARSGAFELSASDGARSSSAPFRVVDSDMAAGVAVGAQLRSYRLALVTDPSYADYFGGSANVTAAKVSLINRVTQVYEDETSIRLVLIDATDKLNLDTAAQMTGANGPCGATACFTATQASTCGGGTLSRNRVVTGLLAGAGNFDVGHIALGLNGGGIASLGVVGGNNKAQGCTGLPTPIGDFFAVDYVAHELGHQFAGNHTFNGVVANCSGGNRNAGTSVEVGSGSSIMAYAGICGTDNLQSHSDPYWSQRSFDEIVAYTSSGEAAVNEVQMVVLRGFGSDGQQFRINYQGSLSAPIVRGPNFNTGGIKNAIQNISGFPAGATVSVTAVSDAAFTVTFGGTLAGTDVAPLALESCSGGCSGFVGEIAAGGPTTRGGTVAASGNGNPEVTVAAGYTIPLRTPFALTGSATDPDGDPVTYMWEQNDRAAGSGTGLISNVKANGPLFRQFGTRALVTSTDTLDYDSAGENHTTADPTRVFPDMLQILANNTNALTGACPVAAATPTASDVECFSEYLPTAAYTGFGGTNASPPSLHFKLTARDGRGGVNSATTTLTLAAGTGPFLVLSPNTAVALEAGATQLVSWDVAGTNAAPVSTGSVKISLSADGGKTWPHVLAENVANSGSASVKLPSIATASARIKVEAVGNVFFDVSDVNFTLRLAGDINADGVLDCTDLAIVKTAYGRRTGQSGFDVRADVVADGVINARDLAYVSQRLPKNSNCAPL